MFEGLFKKQKEEKGDEAEEKGSKDGGLVKEPGGIKTKKEFDEEMEEKRDDPTRWRDIK